MLYALLLDPPASMPDTLPPAAVYAVCALKTQFPHPIRVTSSPSDTACAGSICSEE